MEKNLLLSLIIVIAFVLLIPIPVFAEVEFSKIDLGYNTWQLEVDEKQNRLFFIGAPKTLFSVEIDDNEYSNFKKIQFYGNMIGFDYNAVTQKIYLFDQSTKNIQIIDSVSLQIIDEIEDDFEPYPSSKIRQRDILVNDDTNKIYLLLESYVDIPFRPQDDQKYKIRVFDGVTNNLIKEIELNSTVDTLLQDKSRNLIYAIDWLHQQYFVIDNNENFDIVKLPLNANQYVSVMVLDEKNNQMFMSVSDRNGNVEEILILDTISGNEIQRITDSSILSGYTAIISEKHNVIFFKTVSGSDHGLAIMNVNQRENQIVNILDIPESDLGYLWLVDNTNDKLYGKINNGFVVFDIPSILSSIQSEIEPEPEPVKTADDQYKIICSAPDSYCMEKYGMNNPDSYGECLGTWVPFCQTYEAKQPEPEPEILDEVEIVCGKGTVLIDHICQVDKIEEKHEEYTLVDDLHIPRIEKTIEIPEEKTVDIPEEKPEKKSVNWFSSLFDWFGSLFQ